MNNRTIIAVLLLIGFTMPLQLDAQEINQRYTNSRGKDHLIGKCNKNALLEAPFKEWFDINYNAYEVDKAILKKCKRKFKNVQIEIFMATWCGDSRREVPRFYKVLDELGVKESQITIVNVFGSDSLYKQSPTHEEKGKLIHRVPTFIFYKKGKEIGRIVETPVTSFETDMAQIANGLPPAPTYKIVKSVDDYIQKEGVTTDRAVLLKFAKGVYKQVKTQSALNTYGYVLMSNNEIEKALTVFTLNTIFFSKVPNVWDSLAEAHEKNNELEKALSLYKYALELNPNEKHAKERIKVLEEKLNKSVNK